MKDKFGYLAIILSTILVTIILFEFIGQNYLFKDRLYFVHDVDHWMEPRSREDINSDGIRSTVEADCFHDEDLNIVFLGDSFIYGYELPYDKTIPSMFQSKVRALHPEHQSNVANFGWVSSSPILSLRLLNHIGEKYNPDIVVLAIDMTDFHDDIKYHNLLNRKGIYRTVDTIPATFVAVRKTISKIDWLYEQIYNEPAHRFFITDKPLSETRPYFSYIRDSIDKINDYSTGKLGAKFILLLFPRSYQYSENESPNNWEKLQYQNLGPYAHEPFKYFDQIKHDVETPSILY
jgi:lysophospholipase L1-like esterase